MSALRPRARRDRGQASLELIAALPVLLFVVGLLLQLAVVVWAITDVTDAARQGARAGSMGEGACDAAVGALSSSLRGAATCSAGTAGTVSLEVAAPVLVPGFDDLDIERTARLPDLTDRP